MSLTPPVHFRTTFLFLSLHVVVSVPSAMAGPFVKDSREALKARAFSTDGTKAIFIARCHERGVAYP